MKVNTEGMGKDRGLADSHLRPARLALGLTLAQVAEAMDCSIPAVWQLEQRPLPRIRIATIERYHQALAQASGERTEAYRRVGDSLIEALVGIER